MKIIKRKVVLQKYCDVSNSVRMHMPNGKDNYLAGKKLANEILALIMKRKGGLEGSTQAFTAFGIVKHYLISALGWNIENIDPKEVLGKYEHLFEGDYWMNLIDDGLESDMIDWAREDNNKDQK
jgi:hypothetical protein